MGVGLLAALVYVLVVGGTSSGELQPVLRLINAAIGAALVLGVLRIEPKRFDRLDRALAIALATFALAGALSSFPRQALDATLGAAAFFAAVLVARDKLGTEALRRTFIAAVIGLSCLFTIGAGLAWLPHLLEWWSLAGRSVLPPLNMSLSGGPWGYRYDIALLLAMLYPAWWVGRPSLLRRIGAVGVGLLGLLLVIATGSRTVWGALVLATLTLGLPAAVTWSRDHPHRRPLLAGAVLLGASAGLLTVVLTPLGERLTNLDSLDWRLALWHPLMELWSQHPIAGVGPGSFPWALQLTDYFETRTWAPRHPDNALMQVLPEAGLLGAAALVIVAVAVLASVLRGRSPAATWAVVVFAVACVGGNPTEFSYLVVIALSWVAYAAPRVERERVRPRLASGPIRALSTALLLVIAIAHGATALAAFPYESGRDAIGREDYEAAVEAFGTASRLDPGLALYHRQLGTATLMSGDILGASVHLERASAMNPSDDLAWRTLAVADWIRGDTAAAWRAIGSALEAQRSDPTNLLLAGVIAADDGRTDDAVELLAETVQSWPAIVGAPGWSGVVPSDSSTDEIVGRAAERWLQGDPTPELPSDQGLWLAVLSGREDDMTAATATVPIGATMRQAFVNQLACGDSAEQLLVTVDAAERRSALYWMLRIRASAIEGDIDFGAVQALQIMTGGSYAPATAASRMNAINENTGLSIDQWGYRRPAIAWPVAPVELPSPHAGTIAFLFDPVGAREAAGLAMQSEC